jgi:hypothetical protein
MQQQHQFDERTRLLNISYYKLHKIKINKITKKAIEMPLNQSVIVWNFIKKVKNSISETQHQYQNNAIAIGSERKNKLLNKHNENEPHLLVKQDQLNILLTHSKLSSDDLIVSSQRNDRDNDNMMMEDLMMEDLLMEDLTDFTFSLSTLSSSEQQQENNHYHQSSEFIGQPLDFNIEYFDDNIIDQFEQVISMLLDSE